MEETIKIKQLKVLVIAGTMNQGGIENQFMHLLRKADKSRFQIDFTTTESHPYYYDEIVSLGGRCIHIPCTNGGRNIVQYCKSLYRVIKDGKYDIVHSHELFHSGIVLMIAKLAGVKSRFVHAHNCTDIDPLSEKHSVVRLIYNNLMRVFIRHYATEFCACSTLAGIYLYGDKTIHRKNYHLVFNSIDTHKFLDNYNIKETGEFVDDGWINVLNVGRFGTQKNQMFITQIAEYLKTSGKKIRVLCAGDTGNSYGEAVGKEIRENDLSDYLLLLGDRKDVDSLLRKSRVFILPSKYEGMPLALIEAQASGIPCIAADTFSHEVDFEIGCLQWIDINESAKVWGEAIIEASEKSHARYELVCKAVEEKRFDSCRFAEYICQLYEDSIDS